jgi:polysaccharide deacetylase 2 family uncharacterized protein YibQ
VRRRGRGFAALVASCLLFAGGAALAGDAAPRIALIIDDLGYRLEDGLRAARLPGPVAVAILPHTPHAAKLAHEANGFGKEILLHLPMEAMEPASDPGPGAIDTLQTRDELAAVLHSDLTAVPFARAVSNHMGSLVTRDALRMGWLMAELRGRKPLFFVDSYTTAESVGLEVALQSGVPALRRDVFLDGDPTPGAIAREWQRLLARARERGVAIGIGHPRAATLEFLERELGTLQDAGVELVPLGALLPEPESAL